MNDAGTKFCAQCGTELPGDARFCAECGSALEETAGEPTHVHSEATAETTSGMGGRRNLIIGAAGVLAVLVVVAGSFAFFGGGGSSGDMALAVPNRDDTADLHVVSIGEETSRDTEVERDVRPQTFGIRSIDATTGAVRSYDVVATSAGLIGLWRSEDFDEAYLGVLEPDSQAVADFGANDVNAIWNEGEQRFFVFTSEEGTNGRCYVVDTDGEAERLARGDSCSWSQDVSRMIVTDFGSSGTDLTVVDLDGNEYQILENEEDFEFFVPDNSLSHVSVLVRDRDTGEGEGHLYRVDDGERIAEIDDFDDTRPLFASGDGSAFFFSGRDDGDEAVLLWVDTSGNGTELAQADQFFGLIRLNGGSQVAYTAQEDDQFVLYVQTLESGDRLEVADSDEGFSVRVLPDGRLVVFAQEGEAYLADADGGNAQRIGRLGTSAHGVTGWQATNGQVYFSVSDFADGLTTVFWFDDGADELVELVEEYSQVFDLAVSEDGNWLAFGGREDSGDDAALFVVPTDGSDRPDEVDDDTDGVVTVHFAGNDLIYTMRTGDRSDDYEVRRLRLPADDPPEVLYEEAYVVGIGNATQLTILGSG